MKVRLTNIARALRRRQTDVEAKLWAQLRNRRLDGIKFRRQVPRGPYVVDFLCDAAMLIVELDGSQHSEDTSVAADAVRTKYLGGLGYFVMRFWNADINRDVCGVVETIYATAVSRSNTPSSALRAPSPQGEKANTAATE